MKGINERCRNMQMHATPTTSTEVDLQLLEVEMKIKNRTATTSNPYPMSIVRRGNSLLALFHVSIFLSLLFRTTCGDGEEFASSSAAAGVHLTAPTGVKVEGGHRAHAGLSSPTCQLREKCSQDASRPTSPFSRNCFCDALCTYYDDCCKDYQKPPGGATALADLPRGVATCQRMDDIHTGLPIEVYKVSKCPKDFADRGVRSQCENNVSPATSNRFFLLPVTGNASLVLYRNIFCAICAGERQPIFWLAKLRCGSHLRLNRTSDLKEFIHAACPVDFAPVREWGGLPGDPRRCRSHIGKCDREWRDEATRQRCRQETNYVYAGNRAFRNKHCAKCNHVNETYLRCDDVKSSPDIVGVATDAYFEGSAPFVVTLDFNKRHAVVTETKTGSGYVAETRNAFPDCPSTGGVYDPFIDDCRQVTCSPDMEFLGGRCVPMSTLQNDREAEEVIESRGLRRLSAGDGDDYDDDKENNTELTSSVFVTSVAMDTIATSRVAPPFEPMSARFVLFQMNSLQRLLSIVGTLFCLLSLVVYVVLYYLFSVLRSDGANRYVVCYSVCLIVAHLLFLFVILPNDNFPGPLACFGLSVVIQYAYMTAFFWLSVMTIDVFHRLTTSDPRSADGSPDQRGQCACFALFSVYAWLIPAAAMAGSTAIAVLRLDGWDQLYDGKTRGCFMLGLSQLLLFILPISLVIATNVSMYVIVTCRLCLEPRPINKNPELLRQTAKDKKRFVICVQLTVVMTTTWVMALTAHLTGLSLLWYVFIAFDTLQGLSVCLAFVWKVKVWHLFNRRTLVITKHRQQQQQQHQQLSDGVDSPMIEPFVGTPPDCSPRNSNSRLDSILRETSI